MNNNLQEQTKWSENVILVDADYEKENTRHK